MSVSISNTIWGQGVTCNEEDLGDGSAQCRGQGGGEGPTRLPVWGWVGRGPTRQSGGGAGVLPASLGWVRRGPTCQSGGGVGSYLQREPGEDVPQHALPATAEQALLQLLQEGAVLLVEALEGGREHHPAERHNRALEGATQQGARVRAGTSPCGVTQQGDNEYRYKNSKKITLKSNKTT